MSSRRRYPTVPSQSQNQDIQPVFNLEVTPVPVLQQEEQLQPPTQAFEPKPIITQPYQMNPHTLQNQLLHDTQQYYQERAEEHANRPQIIQSDLLQFTHSSLPVSQSELNKFTLPVGLIFTPNAPVTLPIVDFNKELRINPPRCSNCKCYMNCYSKFTSSGRHVCNLCSAETQLEFEYERICKSSERFNRNEFLNEAYQIRAPDIYRVRKSETFETISLIFDVSHKHINSGQLELQINTIIQNLQQLTTRTMIQITLVSTQVHFAVFRSKSSFELYTVPEIEDSYIPAPRDLIVSLQQRGEAVFHFLRNLLSLAKTIQQTGDKFAIYPAINSVHKCMQGVGGKMLIFTSNSNSISSSTPQDIKSQFTANKIYVDLATKCALSYTSVDVFAFSQPNLTDFAELCRISSGKLHLYDFSQNSLISCQNQLINDINSSFHPETALEACIRIRASSGIELSYFFGKGHFGSQNLVNVSHCAPNDTFSAQIDIRDGFKMGQYIFFQLSFLYTDKSSNRWIRVVTRRVRATSTLEFFNSLHPENTALLLSKKLSIAIKRETYINSLNQSYQPADSSKSRVKGSISSNNDFVQFLDGIMGSITQFVKNYAFLNNFASLEQFSVGINTLLYILFGLQKSLLCKPKNSVLLEQRVAFASWLEHCDGEDLVSAIIPKMVNYQGESVRPAVENVMGDGIYVLGSLDRTFVYFGEKLQMSQIQPFLEGGLEGVDGVLKIGVENEFQIHIQKLISEVQQGGPVFGISGQGRFKGEFLKCLIESRVDGLGWVDFQRILLVNLK